MKHAHHVAVTLLVAACTPSHHSAVADREVSAILDAGAQQVDADRRQTVVEPAARDPDAPAEPQRPAGDPADQVEGERDALARVPRTESGALRIDLATALDLAVHYNRTYKSRHDGLYQQGLGLSVARFDFGPQWSWTVGTMWSDQELASGTSTTDTRLGVSQILPTGGVLGLRSSLAQSSFEGPLASSWGSSVGVNLRQPLLRRFGREVSHEALTSAERELLYAVRDFELFRQQFAIDTARTYFDLLSQRQTLANEERNYEQARFDRQRSEALDEVGRQDEQEVFRARRRELQAENDLVDARATFRRAVDQFKVTLGLPIATAVELADEEARFEPIDVSVESAIAAARKNRLDVWTERERIEDAERRLRIAENGLLPDLDLELDWGLAAAATGFRDAGPDDWTGSAALTMSIPLQRTPERNSYQSTSIARAQAYRSLRTLLDQLDVDIADRIRQLHSIEAQIRLQQDLIVAERRAVAVSEIRFESGDLPNRDLLEARQALIDAENALIRLFVSHFIGRLTLRRELGLLFIDRRGMWQ